MGDFINLIKEGSRLFANVATYAYDAFKEAVVGYLQQVKKWSIRFFIAALVPLIVIVPCMVFGLPLGWLYGSYVVYFVLLAAAELLLLFPIFFFWMRVKAVFPTVASDMEYWIDIIKNVVFNGLSLGIFVTLIPVWKSPGALPLLLLVVACWVMLPACSFSGFCKRVYPAVRAVQLLLLSCLLVLQMAFPRQMEQLTWLTGRTIGSTLTAPVKQSDITAEWNTMPWFNNVGEPLVWYSGSGSEGYRLWAAPGFDPDSGKALQPVRDGKIRATIVANLSEKEQVMRERIAAEQAEMARKEDVRRREEQERMEKQRAEIAQKETARRREEAQQLERERAAAAQRQAEQASAEHDSFLTRYLATREVRNSPDKRGLAVVAVSEAGKFNSIIGDAMAGALQEETVALTTSLFTPEFVSDGLFAQVFSGSRAVLKRLELTNAVAALLLARQSVEYSTNASLGNLITASRLLKKSHGNLNTVD